MNQNDVLKMLEAFNAMFALLPDKIVLDTVILYQKRTVTVEVNGEVVEAMYYSKPETERVNPPCDHYVAALWESYEHFGFDLAILIRARDFSCGDCF